MAHPAARNLALELGVAAQALKRGRALDAEARHALMVLLLRAATALLGRVPESGAVEPRALVTVAVQAALEAGLNPLDLQRLYNDAAETCVRPRA